MAIGDVVSSFSAINTTLFFQPAATVECMVSSYFNSTECRLYDGTNYSYQIKGSNQQVKIFINNSIYLRLDANVGEYGSFSGIQIK